MGSNTSKLKKRLKRGDEDGTLLLLESCRDLQKSLDVNKSYGERYNHDTALHLASRHAMKRTLRLFLFDRGGNPNKKNTRLETSLHCACQLVSDSIYDSSAREECVNMLLQWRGSKNSGDNTQEQIQISAQDKTLVEKGAPIFTENNSKQTPCEMAEQASHFTIATFLESQMVFYNDEGDRSASPEEITSLPPSEDENLPGMKPLDLLEAKDTLIVETCDMLRVPLFTAEVLLRNHEWSRQLLLDAWIADARACCEKCGVEPPADLDSQAPTTIDYELDISTIQLSEEKEHQSRPCEICYDDVTNPTDVILLCEHTFCKDCWTDYLHVKIKEGDSHNIQCPAYGCARLVPVTFIEKMVSNTMARRYLQFDIKAFVDSNPQIVWCPHPGCGLAVQHPDRVRSASVTSQSSLHSKSANTSNKLTASSLSNTGSATRCSNGHSFCWSCQLEPPHQPATCEQYKMWLTKIAQVKREEFDEISRKSEAAANVFWMMSNSKKCPNCKSPIEKNEGCNHMRCSRCKHDFCWVCLEPWKWHNSMTGGFFRCTRYEVVEKVEEQQQTDMSDATERHKSLQELNRFVHYYSRYDNHRRSLEIEKPLLDGIKQKMAQLVTSHTKLSAARFLEEAISVLIRSRHILQFGYVFGYYLNESSMKKMVFELLQTELEEKTEHLSEIIARPYLRTPKSEIMKATKQVTEKTDEFLMAIDHDLLPYDLPHVDERAASAAGPSLWLSDSDDSNDDHNPGKQNRRKGQQQISIFEALEMSRLQLLQDMDSLTTAGSSSETSGDGDTPASVRRRRLVSENLPGTSSSTAATDPILEHVLRLSESTYTEEQDEELSLAIEMSLKSADLHQRQRAEDHTAADTTAAPGANDSLNTGDSSSVDSELSHSTTEMAASEQSAEQHYTGGNGGARGGSHDLLLRLDELDNAIAELLSGSPTPENCPQQHNHNLRRSESDRRQHATAPTSTNVTPRRRVTASVRRSKSDRRNH